MLRTLKTAICCFSLLSPAMAAPPQYAYRISFWDKAGSPAITATPSWLSARSLSRRAAFGIALDSTDRPVSPAYIDSVLRLSGGKMHNTSRWLNQCVVLLTDTSLVATLRAKSWIRRVEWVGYFASGLHREHATANGNPKSEPQMAAPVYSAARQTGSSAYYGNTYGQTLMVHGDTLHDQGFRGKDKIIAVLDAGFREVESHRGFDSLRQQGRLLETYNFVRDTSFIYAYDDHGTACLSTIAGVIPGSFVGTAPDAKYALYVTEDGAFVDAIYELDNLVAGMERADSLGADVISASLGYNTFSSPFNTSFSKSELDGVNTLVARAANIATAKGMLYVASAGNEGGNGWNYIVSPADADSVLAVGAVTPSRSPASFSSPGPNAAGRIKPDVCLQGDPAAILISGGSIGTSAGTSFAAPQAAGYAACLMQAFPTLPPAFIRDAFAHISHLYTAPTSKLGYGIPDFRLAQQYLSRFLPDGKLRVFPNPFLTNLTVVLPSVSSVSEVVLQDAVGRTIGVQQARSGNVLNVVPMRELSSGIYILSVIADGQQYTQKLTHY